MDFQELAKRLKKAIADHKKSCTMQRRCDELAALRDIQRAATTLYQFDYVVERLMGASGKVTA